MSEPKKPPRQFVQDPQHEPGAASPMESPLVEVLQVPSPAAWRSIQRTDRQALIMAASVLAITFASWGSAHFACNRRIVQFKEPAKLSTEQLTLTAKDAAIEFIQRELTGDFAGALEIVSGAALAEELKAKIAACASSPASCTVTDAQKLEISTLGEVLLNEGTTSQVRTVSSLGSEQRRCRLRVERRGSTWKVVERILEP